jgi:hypothetical protein
VTLLFRLRTPLTTIYPLSTWDWGLPTLTSGVSVQASSPRNVRGVLGSLQMWSQLSSRSQDCHVKDAVQGAEVTQRFLLGYLSMENADRQVQ